MERSSCHKALPIAILVLCHAIIARAQPTWPVNPAEYAYNMTITTQLRIGGLPNHATGNRIAVYVGDEVRGSAAPVLIAGQAFYFITIYSNVFSGDTLKFKAYIAAGNTIYTSTDKVIFKHNTALGKIAAPYSLNFSPSEIPQIYTSNQINFQENTCFELHDVQTLDNEDSEGNGLSYSLNGGADVSKFSLNSATGKLAWLNFTPDFENPQDANGDNRYEVKIRVTDSDGNFSIQSLLVRVTDNTYEIFDPHITGNQFICAGQMTTLQADGGTQYLWNTGVTTAILPNVGTGTYTVTITNAFACTALRSATVGGNNVSAGTVGSNQGLCPGNTDPAPFTSLAAGTGSGTLSYRWEKSTAGCGSGFSTIPAASGATYDAPSGLTQTSYFHRVAISTLNGLACEAVSNCVTVSNVDNIAPTALCKNASVTLGAAGTVTITTAQVNNGSSDNCAIGMLSVNPSTFNCSNGGANTVTLTVTDQNSNTSTCTATVTVTTGTPTAYNLTTSTPTVCVNDNATLNLSGSETGKTYQVKKAGVNIGSAVNGTGNALVFTILAANMSTGANAFTVVATNTATTCSATMSGTATVTVNVCNPNITGTITWADNTAQGVKDATVNVTGDASGSTLTASNGSFSLTMAGGTNFVVKAVKTLNPLNGVTSADVTLIQQQAGGSNVITNAYRQVAADINKSNSITSADATLLNQAILGNQTALATLTANSWRFINAALTLNVPPWSQLPAGEQINISGPPYSGKNFKGVKVGDVNGSASPQSAPMAYGEPMVWSVVDQALQAGKVMVLTFRANAFVDLAAFQFALHFDPAALEFLSVLPLDALPLGAEHFGKYRLENGELRCSWAVAEGLTLPDQTDVFQLSFRALQTGPMLSAVLQLDEVPLVAEAYRTDLQPREVLLEFNEATTGTGGPLAGGQRGLDIYPNPFSGKTTLGFDMLTAGEARLRIYNASGRLVAEASCDGPAGYREAVFDLSNLPAQVLYGELTTPLGVITRKMVRQ